MNSLLPAIVAALTLTSTAIWAASGTTEGSNLGNVKGGDFSQAHVILEKKCTACHSMSYIDSALKAGKDMGSIQKKMENKGAQLSSKEREVLGIYWTKNPLKK